MNVALFLLFQKMEKISYGVLTGKYIAELKDRSSKTHFF